MKNYNEFVQGLQCDMEIPREVRERMEETLAMLPDKAPAGRRGGHGWTRWAASAAAAAIVGTGLCWANPALASRIPVIGQIFADVEENVTFSGSYSGKSEVLTEEMPDTAEPADAAYTVSSQGTEITASEVYCDGLSVFLTARITVEGGGLQSIPEMYTSAKKGEAATVAQGLYTKGSWSLEGQKDAQELQNVHIEGRALDDHTFIGMIKLDLPRQEKNGGVLQLNLTQISYDDLNELDSEEITPFHEIEGSWELSVPFATDTEAVREIAVNAVQENGGYAIEKAVLSPYQLVVYASGPDTTLSREEWEARTEQMELKREMTYEDYLAEKALEIDQPPMAAYNQDGEELMLTETYHDRTVFAVKDVEITGLSLFLFDNYDDEEQARAGKLETAKELAVLSAELALD